MRKIGILQLLATSSFITINKEIAKKFGINGAVLLGELASELDYWTKNNGLVDGYFFSTIENIEESTTLTKFQQNKALGLLKKEGLVDVKIKGLPAKRYIKIDEKSLVALLISSSKETCQLEVKKLDNKELNNLPTSSKESSQQEVKKLDGNNNIYNNNINNNNPPIIPQGDEGVFFCSSNSKVKDFEQRDSELKKKFLEICEMYPKERLWNSPWEREQAFKNFLNSVNRDKEEAKRGIKKDINVFERMRIGIELYMQDQKKRNPTTTEYYKLIGNFFKNDEWKSYYEEEKEKSAAQKEKEEREKQENYEALKRNGCLRETKEEVTNRVYTKEEQLEMIETCYIDLEMSKEETCKILKNSCTKEVLEEYFNK